MHLCYKLKLCYFLCTHFISICFSYCTGLLTALKQLQRRKMTDGNNKAIQSSQIFIANCVACELLKNMTVIGNQSSDETGND